MTENDPVTYGVILTPTSQACLDRLVAGNDDSPTDVFNYAIQTYAYLVEIWKNDGDVLVRRTDDGPIELLKVFG